uniref:Aldehyde oxidase/xanthine dehydrogenase first molybdopterin binding domain-containing protein n=1 Tax=Amphimedon queenslandica TaxID=400682 RepID=A0A1X7T605_AMPQE
MLGLAGDPEIVFATDVSEYAGQAVGLAVADTQEHALQMAKAVTLTYQSQGKQILTIQDAIDAKSFYDKKPDIVIGDADGSIKGSDHFVTGDIYCDTQYHFTMETQTTFVIPEDDGYTVYSSNQWAQLGQFAVAGILGIPENKVTVVIKRVGGAYGSKISRASQVAAACALGSYVTQRPVRLHMDLESNMKMVGKRYPYYAKYTVGCTKAGVLNGIKIDVFTDAGCSSNDSYLPYALRNLDNTYNCSNWSVTQTTCRTHTPSNTYTRAPGYLPGVFIIESLMDDVATKIGMDVEEFKHANFYKKGDISLLFKVVLERLIPGIYIKMVAFGKTPTEDSYNSFFLDSNKQVELACDLLSSDEMLANGFNAMGFSQGSQFLRALVQRCGSVKIYNLISLGGQHNGVYGFPFCPGSSSILCHLFRRFLGMGTYLSFIQDNLVQAQYWHDPYDEESYALDCEFLSDINQELVFKPSYKERFSNISNFVLVKFEYDMMVEPKETEWFGFYKEHQSVKTYSMFESKIYRR